MRNLLLPLLALGMLLFGVSHIRNRQKETPQTPPPIKPVVSPYAERIAGAGLVEAATENLAIGTHLQGIVDQVFVQVGQRVRANDPLFELDTRLIRSQIAVQEMRSVSSRAELSRLEQLPRAEDLPPVVARREQADAIVRQWEDEYARQQKLALDGATTESSLVASRQKLAAARADAAGMKAEEDRLRAGAWEADKTIARAAVALADAEVLQLKTQLDLHRVCTPELTDAAGAVELTVLQVNVRPGEAVDTASGKTLVMLGDVRRKHVRVDIDEHDVPRFRSEGAATGVFRGDVARSFPLKFMRLEPFVLPKRSLTGDNTERIDTRVLQVLYEIAADADAIFIGQQMDVFIESRDGAAATGGSSGIVLPAAEH
ncbi:MAG: HlyD family secretion protein [Planctomyces sp.]|jgi:multidrug efflux pump subunit AcrA (membrane-fusion protein)